MAEDYSEAKVQISDIERDAIRGPLAAYTEILDPTQAQQEIETQISRVYYHWPEIADAIVNGAQDFYDAEQLREELRVSNAGEIQLTGTRADAIRSLVAMSVFAGYIAGRGSKVENEN